jgi:hypothetical protein
MDQKNLPANPQERALLAGAVAMSGSLVAIMLGESISALSLILHCVFVQHRGSVSASQYPKCIEMIAVDTEIRGM